MARIKRAATFKPNVFVAGKSGTAFLCGCKITENLPYCDGTHNTILHKDFVFIYIFGIGVMFENG